VQVRRIAREAGWLLAIPGWQLTTLTNGSTAALEPNKEYLKSCRCGLSAISGQLCGAKQAYDAERLLLTPERRSALPLTRCYKAVMKK
jgi:hypothetical protein